MDGGGSRPSYGADAIGCIRACNDVPTRIIGFNPGVIRAAFLFTRSCDGNYRQKSFRISAILFGATKIRLLNL